MSKTDKGDFMSRAGKRTKKGYRQVKTYYKTTVAPAGIKAGGKLARHYKKYVRPTAKIVRGVGRFARGTLKVAARFPGTGLAATGLYYAGKHIIKKGEKTVKRSAFRQYDKKGKWLL